MHIDSLILYSARIQETVAFYRALGLPLEEESHADDDPLHFACEFNDVHIAIFEGATGAAPTRGTGGAAQFGFQVSSVDEAFAAATKAGAKTLVEPQERPWGRRAVIEDPDGRPVELNQA